MATRFEQLLQQERRSQEPLGTQPGFQAPPPGGVPLGNVGGFIASALSAIPEFIGAEPTAAAANFRAANSWQGLASEILPLMVPYTAAYRLSQLPAVAPRLEAAVGRIIDPMVRPVLGGATRELVRFAPLEAGRLTAGAMVYPENLNNLFADVVFSQAFAGGFGMIGGFFRAGGRAVREPRPGVRDVDMYAAPTVQLRALVEDGAELVDPGFGRDAARAALRNQVFTEQPGVGGVSGRQLNVVPTAEGSRGPQDLAELNTMFALSTGERAGRGQGRSGLRRQSLAEGPEDQLTSLNEGQQQEVAALLGMEDADQLAANVFYPRLLTPLNGQGAGTLGRLFQNPILRSVDDNTWMGRVGDDGLHIFVRRLEAGPERQAASVVDTAAEGVAPAAARRVRAAGPAQVRPGDRWLIGLTDRPGRISPQGQLLEDTTYASWARWRSAWQEPNRVDETFSIADDEFINTLTPQDFRDAARIPARTWKARVAQRVTRQLTGDATLTDSATGRAVAEGLYDIVAPNIFKQGRNAMYARFDGMLRNRVRIVREQVNRMMVGSTHIDGNLLKHVNSPRFRAGSQGSIAQHWQTIYRNGDQGLVYKAALTQTPADDLARLADDGVVRADTIEAVRALQAIDQDYLSRTIMPALEATGNRHKFNLLEGYIMPVPRLGDFMQQVSDESGRAVALVTGRTRAHAHRQADAIVAEAERQGRKWTTSQRELMHTASEEPESVTRLMEQVMRRVGTDEAADTIVRDAMKKLQYTTHGGRQGVPTPTGAPNSFKQRSGLSEVVEVPSLADTLANVRGHYEQLGRFAAVESYMERWGGELQRYAKVEPTLHNNLMRSRNQYLGFEGQITNTLNNILRPVLGSVLGSKPATRIAAATNELMYGFNLAWFNPTFAVLNGLTPIMTVLPHIAFATRASRVANNRLMQFAPLYGERGPVGVSSHLSPLKILSQAVRDIRAPEPELRRMLSELTDDGTLSATIIDEIVGHGPATLRESFRQGHYLQLFRDASTYMARKSEEFARVVSANAGFRVGRDLLGLQGPALKNYTRKFVETTNYMYGVTDRPRMFTGPVGSVFGLFKNWQMHYLGMMANYAGVAWREGVYSPLLWQAGAALSLGGLGATPLRHVADGISEWYSGDPQSYRWMMQNWPNAADEIWFGLPAFLGVSLQASSAMPGTDVRNEITNLGNIVLWERGRQLGQAVGAAIDQSRATGGNPLEHPNVRDQLLASIMPRWVSRLYSGVEADYVRSMRTGYPQVRDVSPSARIMHMMGINQIEVERQQVAARELHRNQERTRMLTTGLGSAYAQASLRGDSQEMEQLIQRTILLGIPLSRVMQSANNFERRETESDSLSRFDRVEAGRWRQALEESE